jgi:hypothetical protein
VATTSVLGAGGASKSARAPDDAEVTELSDEEISLPEVVECI